MSTQDFSCSHCGKFFNSVKGVELHEVMHYPSDHPKRVEMRLKCPFDGCTHSTDQMGNMDRHVETKHTNTKSKICVDCGRGFGDPAHLHRHRVAKHAYKPKERKSRKPKDVTVKATEATKEPVEKGREARARKCAPYERSEAVAGPSGSSHTPDSSPSSPGTSQPEHLLNQDDIGSDSNATFDFLSSELFPTQEYDASASDMTFPSLPDSSIGGQSVNEPPATTSLNDYWDTIGFPLDEPQLPIEPLAPYPSPFEYLSLPTQHSTFCSLPAPDAYAMWQGDIANDTTGTDYEAALGISQSGSLDEYLNYEYAFPSSPETSFWAHSGVDFGGQDMAQTPAPLSTLLPVTPFTIPPYTTIDESLLVPEQKAVSAEQTFGFDSELENFIQQSDSWAFLNYLMNSDTIYGTETTSTIPRGPGNDEEQDDNILGSGNEPDDDTSPDADSVTIPDLPPPPRTPIPGVSLYDENEGLDLEGGGIGEGGEFDWEKYFEGGEFV